MIYIGIDPDVHKSGYAIWDTKQRRFIALTAYNFFDIIQELLLFEDLNPQEEIKIILEAGWLNKKSNYHFSAKKNIGERIAKNVGANHQIGKLLEEFFKRNSLSYQLTKPTQTKTDRDTFTKITGLTIKNQDIIDAGMLVYGL